jgi:hypothetical protein
MIFITIEDVFGVEHNINAAYIAMIVECKTPIASPTAEAKSVIHMANGLNVYVALEPISVAAKINEAFV